MNEMEKVLTNIGEKTLEEVINLVKPQFEQYAKDAVSLANEALGMSAHGITIMLPTVKIGSVNLIISVSVAKA